MDDLKETGQVYGIIDPDYGRIYTMVRKLAWEEGYAIGLHGSFTRDLDMIAVPWEAGRRCNPEKLVARILQATGLKEAHGNPGIKPHGRKVWTLLLPEFSDPRFVDLSIMPCPEVPQASAEQDAQDKIDATRYRHMRNLTVEQAGAAGQPSIALPSGLNHGYYLTEETADYAIDESVKQAAASNATRGSDHG